MADEIYLTPEERLSKLGDILLASSIGTDSVSKQNRQILFGQFTPRVFRDENHIIYKVFYNLKESGVSPDEEFMRLYLTRNEGVILKSDKYIDITAYADLDESPATGYTVAVLKHFAKLKGMQPISQDDFKLQVEKYKLEYQCIEFGSACSQAKTILYDGLKEGRRLYQGYDDSVSHLKRDIANIDSVIDTTAGAGFIDASIVGMIDDTENKPVKIGDFGEITELNDHLGGIYTPYFYSILAPTKGGKSKFTTKMIHNIAIENGNNVVVWAHEGGYQAWLAQLRALHFDWLYNRNEPDVARHKRGVTQKVIIEGSYPSDAVKVLEDASRVDLFTNPQYGNIHMIDRPFKVDTFIDEIETAVQLNSAKAVLVDYLQLVDWDERGVSKSQAIGRAYQKLLAYAKKRNVAVISPAQFTQSFMNEMAKSQDGDTHEVRTAGGESSEIIRTPDINIALYATAEDLMAHTMKILSVPSRLAQPFPPFDIYCDLGVCQFSSLNI